MQMEKIEDEKNGLFRDSNSYEVKKGLVNYITLRPRINQQREKQVKNVYEFVLL